MPGFGIGYGFGANHSRRGVVPSLPTSAFAVPAVSIPEGNSGTTTVSNTVNVTRNGATGPLVVNLAYSGTAAAGSDYVAGPSSVTIADGANSASFDLQISGDATVDPDETIIVGATLAAYPSAVAAKTITITNDDIGPAAFLPANHDAASYDSTTSTITGASTSQPIIRIAADIQSEQLAGTFGQFFARISGMTGRTLKLECDGTKFWQVPPMSPGGFTNWCFVWRYLGDGVNDWRRFDTNAVSGKIVSGTTSAAFTQDVIEVAWMPRWRESDYIALWSELAASPYAYEPPSSIAASTLPAFVHAQVSPGTIQGNDVAAAPANLRCMKIADPSLTPIDGQAKMNVVSQPANIRWRIRAIITSPISFVC